LTIYERGVSMHSDQRSVPTDPFELEKYLERLTAYQHALAPEVVQLVDALSRWQFAAELQPRPTFVNTLSHELQVKARRTTTQATKHNPMRILAGMLTAGAAVAVIVLLLIYTGGFFPASEVEPAAVDRTFSDQPYTFYLSDSFASNELIPLDAQTLDQRPDGVLLELGLVSADGSIRVDVEYPEGRGSLDPEDIWIVVYDLSSGVERSRFHPPVRAIPSGLSEDGSRLLLLPFPEQAYASFDSVEAASVIPPAPYPPRVEWYVVDTASGEVVAHIKDEENGCFRQAAQFDPAGQRIYCVSDPSLVGMGGPQPMRLTAYDLESGSVAAVLDLPKIRLGGSGIQRTDESPVQLLEPAVALSPDGRRLAIVHADTDQITLLDARRLTVERTLPFARPSSLLDMFISALGERTSEMVGSVRQAEFSADGQYLYVYAQEGRIPPDLEAPESRGLWLVDLTAERVMAEALPEYQIQWVQPAPDGTVYVFGTTDEDLGPYEIREASPSMLWRLDDLTFEILAARKITGYRGRRLVVTPATQ
jgi:hypothetical protein